MKNKKLLYFGILIIILSTGCTRDRNNPYDPNNGTLVPLTDTSLTNDPLCFAPIAMKYRLLVL